MHLLALPLRALLVVPSGKPVFELRCCAKADPFRSDRPPIEPLVINSIQELLQHGGSGETLAEKALQATAPTVSFENGMRLRSTALIAV